MTAHPHSGTRSQRADDATVASDEARDRGYEERDAPPREVLIGIGAFLGLMLSGLLFAGGTLWWLRSGDTRPRTPFVSERIMPSEPRILAAPAAERRRIEAAAAARLDAGALDWAMREVVAQGWGEDAATPSTEQTALAHREAAR